MTGVGNLGEKIAIVFFCAPYVPQWVQLLVVGVYLVQICDFMQFKCMLLCFFRFLLTFFIDLLSVFLCVCCFFSIRVTLPELNRLIDWLIDWMIDLQSPGVSVVCIISKYCGSWVRERISSYSAHVGCGATAAVVFQRPAWMSKTMTVAPPAGTVLQRH